MTTQERKKLAKAARELASLYVEGNGPRLSKYSYCGCALGQVFKMAGVPNDGGHAAADLEDTFDDDLLTHGTFREVGSLAYPDPTPGAVVFPLLWLADELESAP